MSASPNNRTSFKPHDHDEALIQLMMKKTGLNRSEIIVRCVRYSGPLFLKDPGLMAMLPPRAPEHSEQS